MTFETWILFTAAAFLNIISPGPSILLAISNGVSSGSKAVVASSLGNVVGLFVLSTVSMFGLGLLLQTSAILFMGLKFIGAGYLIYLGIKKFRSTNTFFTEDAETSVKQVQYMKKFKEALLVAITNPKAILFFIAFFPIFLDTHAPALPQFAIMTLTFMSLSFLSLVTYGSIAKSARHWFKSKSIVKAFHRVTGGIFIGFGIALLQVKN
ncbi:LysE family translocator [Marinomonas sp. 2405UD68-3]|uniref:LysE family translocator n=1 Tax=Marinomonas sp. 2405UD68-3 TaxID=3391835 RepID=UPI0039C8F455